MLNLLRQSPAFAMRESATGDRLLQPDQIPDEDGIWWVSGTLTTSGGEQFDAVFIVGTDDGGDLHQVYVWVDRWLPVSELPLAAGVASDVFPFDYATAIPLARDIFHD